MRRKEIKDLFTQMGLTYYPSKNPKNERWKIPNEDLTIRILVSYETADHSSFSSAPSPVETHWAIQMKGRFSSTLTVPEDAIKEIQRMIYNQFERQFNQPNDYEWEEVTFHGGGASWTQWATYQPLTIPEPPKPSFYRPTRLPITKGQVNIYRAKTHRLGYSGKR